MKADLYARTCLYGLTILLVTVEAAFISGEKGGVSLPRPRIVDRQQAELLEYINMDKENVYLYTDMVRFGTAYNMWASHPVDYLDNYIPLTAEFVFGCVMILANLGQRSYNSRTTFPKYSDSVLELSGQETLSQRDKLTS